MQPFLTRSTSSENTHTAGASPTCFGRDTAYIRRSWNAWCVLGEPLSTRSLITDCSHCLCSDSRQSDSMVADRHEFAAEAPLLQLSFPPSEAALQIVPPIRKRGETIIERPVSRRPDRPARDDVPVLARSPEVCTARAHDEARRRVSYPRSGFPEPVREKRRTHTSVDMCAGLFPGHTYACVVIGACSPFAPAAIMWMCAARPA